MEYKTHSQTRELIENSRLKNNRRLKRLLFALLAFTALIFGFTRYNASRANSYHLKALQSQRIEQNRAYIKSNTATDKAIVYFKKLKTLNETDKSF